MRKYISMEFKREMKTYLSVFLSLKTAVVNYDF